MVRDNGTSKIASLSGVVTIFKRFFRLADRQGIKKPWLEFYDSGIPACLSTPEKTMIDVLDDTVERNGQRVFLIYFGRKMTYSRFRSLVSRCATGLKSLEISKGDRIALILPNIPQFLIAYWAILEIGAVVVAINPILSEREMLDQMNQADVKAAVVLDRIYSRLVSVGKKPVVPVVTASVEQYMPAYLSLAMSLERRRLQIQRTAAIHFERLLKYPAMELSTRCIPGDPAVMIFTGGVTGEPKAAVLSHRNLVANTEQACAWISDLKNEVILAVLPLIHSYGMTACHHVSVRSGAVLILEPRFSLKRIVNDIRKYKVTLFPGVPTMFSAIHNFAAKKTLNLSGIRACISGGAPLSGELKENFEKMTGGKLVEGYGLTEASPIVLCNPIHGLNKTGSVGLPWPGTLARIAHLKTGLPLAPYQKGELQIKGPQVMHGYWKKPEETRKIISADGWLSTGDIAYFDRDGYFYIVDRKKDLIFHGGSNIYPGEVEGVLMEHPHILEAAVIGIPDKHYGEVIKAFIVADPVQSITENDIIRFCEDKLAKYKIPGEIEFRTQLPKNFLGKVIHRKLRE